MNATILCFVSVLAAPPMNPAVPSVYSPSPAFEYVVRGQSPEAFYPSPPVYAQGPTFVQPGTPIETVPPTTVPSGPVIPNGTFVPDGTVIPDGMILPEGTILPDSGGIPTGPPTYSPVLPPSSPGAPLGVDPFLGGGVVTPLMEYADPPGTLPVSYSNDGFHPYRFGITHRLGAGFMPDKHTERDPASSQFGDMGIFEFDYENEYTSPIFDRSIFSHTFQYGLRTWDGPTNADPPGTVFNNAIDLPGNVHRFGSDFELTTPLDSPLVFQAGFNPSINTDFENGLSREAVNLDARAVFFNRISPRTTLVSGLLYWDRVDDILLPYAGVICKPNPRREYLLVFPHPRISFMVGDPGGIQKWLYVRGEYHVESYHIQREPLIGSPTGAYEDQIQISDWRVLGGFRTVNPYGVSAFFEAGAVFGREVEFLRGTPDFDISSGFIARAGLHF